MERIAANLKDLGDESESGRARDAGAASRGRRARGRLRGRGGAGGSAAQAETVRRDRKARAAGHHSRQQHLGHPDHQDHERAQAARPRARHPLVEPAVSGAAGRGDRDAMDLAARGRFHHEAACRRRQKAGACEKGRSWLHRQPAAACIVARGDRAGRARHLRRRDRRQRHQGVVRPPLGGARPVGKCRHGRHRSDAGDPQIRAARHRQPSGAVALSQKTGEERQAWLQERRRLSQMEPGATSRHSV